MTTLSNIEEKHLEEVKAPQSVVHIKHSITLRQYKIWLVQSAESSQDNRVKSE